jgi:hypothetical protein
MNQTFTATLTSPDPTATFYTITENSPTYSNLAYLEIENYPDRPQPIINYISTETEIISTITYPIVEVSLESANLPNSRNQSIFKEQTVQWWVDGINNKTIVYTPVSNKVNWSYSINSNLYHISTEITNLIIPRDVDTFQEQPELKTTVITFKDSGYMTMTSTYQFNA